MASYNFKNYQQLEMMTYAIFNTYVRDNFEAVRQPALQVVETTNGSDFTTTSTSFVDISATYYQVTITPSILGSLTCRLEVNMRGLLNPNNTATNYTVYFDVLIGGVSVSGGTGIQAVRGNSGVYYPLNLTHVIQNVSVGAKTVKLQWKVESGATARLYAANGGTTQMKGQFSVREF
jgi:hypothetical protein